MFFVVVVGDDGVLLCPEIQIFQVRGERCQVSTETFRKLFGSDRGTDIILATN